MNINGIDQWDNIYSDMNILKDDIIKKQLYISLSEGIIESVYVLKQKCDEQYVSGTWKYPNSTYYV